MYYSQIRKMDVSDGPGIRVALYVSGCTHHCPGCFNPETWSFTNGHEYTDETEHSIIEALNKPYIQGLSILGGDPLCQDRPDTQMLVKLVVKARHLNKDIWMWTGSTYEQVFGGNTMPVDIERRALVNCCDVLIDGPFIESQKDLTLPYCGSRNQRVIDIKQTLESGQIVLYSKK